MEIGTKYLLSFKLEEKIHQGFIDLFHDDNPMHVDAEFAMSKGFDENIMHGNILNGFVSYFVGKKLPIQNVIIHSQEIHYKKPIYLNQALDFEAEISDYFESVKTYQLKFIFFYGSKIFAKGKIQIGVI
jgi:3-hydroxybutyryl-CoA dehydratase